MKTYYKVLNFTLKVLGWLFMFYTGLFIVLTLYSNFFDPEPLYPIWGLFVLMPLFFLSRVLSKIDFKKIRKWALDAGFIYE